MTRAAFPPSFDYSRNSEVLAEFYRLQGELTQALAQRPAAVLRWLDRQRVPRRCTERRAQSARWRTARLSGCRQRELRRLLAENSPGLAAWLLASLPAGTLIDIDEVDTPGSVGPLGRSLLALREQILRANLGLAKAAALRAGGRPHEFDDRLSAACSGLLDAIDRYVPGPGAARFAYFAAYWIRYHVARFGQKHSCIIAYPIHQQRTAQREMGGRSDRPIVVGLRDEADGGDALLNEPAPDAWGEAEEDELRLRVRLWLKRSVPPATRLMLAAVHSIGPLPEAAGDYLEHLCEIARDRLRDLAEPAPCLPSPRLPTSSPPARASVPMCT